MSKADIPDFLARQRDVAPPELQGSILELEDFWERKLWHQLTETLLVFFDHPDSAPQRLGLYKNFILTIADKINQLKLVQLALSASTQCDSDEERLAFLQSLANKVNNKNSQDAYVYASVAVAHVKLSLEQFDDARKDLDGCEKILDSFDSIENVVHAAFYDANASYYQQKNDFAAYYRNALLYLACIDINSLTLEDRYQRAYNLSVAALVSKNIYNFGELLLHPILQALAESKSHAWLYDLLFAFNRGDLVTFDRLSDKIKANSLLHEHADTIRQKLYLAALTETIFRRPPHDRAMTFSEICEQTRVRSDEIELLIMKALSLGLLRGSIDQVEEMAYITWVQPKVLDKSQVQNMRRRLLDWDSNINQLGNWIEQSGKDLWAA